MLAEIPAGRFQLLNGVFGLFQAYPGLLAVEFNGVDLAPGAHFGHDCPQVQNLDGLRAGIGWGTQFLGNDHGISAVWAGNRRSTAFKGNRA